MAKEDKVFKKRFKVHIDFLVIKFAIETYEPLITQFL